MRAEIAGSINDFSASDWNRLAGHRYPFLRHEFLKAAEDSGSAGPEAGWTPRHVGIYDEAGRLCAAMPLYEKSHSWGEFVFDWSWAHAYERAGLDYYPKLVAAIPFTPATSCRLLADNDEFAAALVETGLEFARNEGYSSLHILFPEETELGALESAGLKLRKDCQFHWHNRDYRAFDDFLATFSSAKRKKVRRDRRRVSEQGITFRRTSGRDADASLWRDVYELISITFHATRIAALLQPGLLPGSISAHAGQPVDHYSRAATKHDCGSGILRHRVITLWPLLGSRRPLRCAAFRNLLLPGHRLLHRTRASAIRAWHPG